MVVHMKQKMASVRPSQGRTTMKPMMAPIS